MKLSARLVVFVLFLSACSAKVIKKDALAQVKRAAVIGLDVQQQKSVSAGDLVGIALKTNESPHPVPSVRVDSPHIDPIYKDLSDRVAEQTGWKMVGLQAVRTNDVYAKLFRERTHGFHNRPMLNDRFVCFAPPAILDGWAAQSSDKEQLIALAKALKVDALVFATSTVNLNNNGLLMSMVGSGKFRPNSQIRLTVIDGRTGENLYLEEAQGPKVDEVAKNVMGVTNEEKLNRLAQNASSLSIRMVTRDLKL